MNFRVIPVFVLLIYAFVLFLSPFGVEARSKTTAGLLRLSGSDEIYLSYTYTEKGETKKYKRLIHEEYIKLYNWLNDVNITTVYNQSDLDAFTTADLVSYMSGERDESGNPEVEWYRIGVDPETKEQTIKRLAMNRNTAVFMSGYKKTIFQINRQEAENQGNYYTQGDPIYFTGTTSWESNVYRKTDTLKAEERGTRIYRTIIPQGENRCTITGDVVAVIGKPGVEYTTITEKPIAQPLRNPYGGNVTIYIQSIHLIDTPTPTPSFTLECRQISPLNVHTINTSTLPEPDITFTHSGIGEQTFEMELPEGYHYCVLKDQDGNTVTGSELNLLASATNDDNFQFNNINIGNTTYNIRVRKWVDTRSIYEGTWTVQCSTPQTIILADKQFTHITGAKDQTAFQFGANTKIVLCKKEDEENYIARFTDVENNNQRENAIFLGTRIEINSFLRIQLLSSFDTQSKWGLYCIGYKDTSEHKRHIRDYTPFLIRPKTECPDDAPNHPNLLCRVIERADEISRARGMPCSNDLSNVEDIVGTVLLVPEDLCIQYKSGLSASGLYASGINVVYISTPSWYKYSNNQFSITMIHELCHAQQDYYVSSDIIPPPTGQKNWEHFVPEFVMITGHQWKPYTSGNSFGWYYPSTGKYYGMYGAGYSGFKPKETGAEFCTAVALYNAGDSYHAKEAAYSPKVPISKDELLERVLEGREWTMDYMLNPNLEPFFAPNVLATLQASNIQITDIDDVERDWRGLLQASFTVSWDEPILHTKLTEQGWQGEYSGKMRVVLKNNTKISSKSRSEADNADTALGSEGDEYDLTMIHTPLSKNSYRVEGVLVNNQSQQLRQEFDGGIEKIEVIITKALRESTRNRKAMFHSDIATTKQINLYQLLIDRGLLNEDGSLPDE